MAWIESHPEGKRVTSRWLREQAGWRVLTKARRQRLQLELLSLGIDTSPCLEDAGIDDEVTLVTLDSAARRSQAGGPSDVQPSRQRGWLIRLGLSAWAGLVVAAVIVGVAADAISLGSLWPDDPVVPKLRGDVNVAVSRFGGVGTSGARAEAAELSQSVASELRREALEDDAPLSPAVEVIGPEKLDELSLFGPLDQRDLERLNATIGVSGTLRAERQATVLITAFRINAKQLHLARPIEPVIERRIRMAGAIDQSIATRIRIRNQVVTSIELIDSLLLGLGELESGHPDTADQLLRNVLRDWPSPSGKQVLNLLLGHALAEQHHDAEARQSYREALELRPGYRRARFALAALDFRAAAGDCSRAQSDARLLWAARHNFDVLARSTVSTLRVKSLFARARAEACLSQMGVASLFESARSTFHGVIASYRRGVPDVRAEAAEAFGWLGLIALPERGGSSRREARTEIRQAVRYYRRARSLAIDPQRRRFFAEEAERWSERVRAIGRVQA